MISSRLVRYLSVVDVDINENLNQTIDTSLQNAGLSKAEIDAFSERYKKNIKLVSLGNKAAFASAVSVVLQLANEIHHIDLGINTLSSLLDIYQIGDVLGWDNLISTTSFIIENSSQIFDIFSDLGIGIEVLDNLMDIEAIVTGGLSVLAGMLAKTAVEIMNKENESMLKELELKTRSVRNLHIVLQKIPSSPKKHQAILELIPLLSEKNLKFA